MSDVTYSTPANSPETPQNTLTWKLYIWTLTVTKFNYDCSYLPDVICNIVVKAHFGIPTPQMHHGIYIMGCIWQPFWILQEKVGISFYFWIIRLVNTQLALYSHVRCNPLHTPWHTWNTPKHPHMTIIYLNSDNYKFQLRGFIFARCHM